MRPGTILLIGLFANNQLRAQATAGTEDSGTLRTNPAADQPKTPNGQAQVPVDANRLPADRALDLQNGPAVFYNRVGDILERENGLRVNRSGAPGSFSTLSVYGANADQTRVSLQGTPLNSPIGGPVNLENLPLAAFGRADIRIGAERLGGFYAPMGGSVDLQLRDDRPPWLVRSGADTLAGGYLGGGVSHGDFLHYSEVNGSANRYRYTDPSGTVIANKTDDERRLRENEDYLQGSHSSIASGQIGRDKYTFLGDLLVKDQGLPGALGQETSEARWRNRRGLIRGSYSHRPRDNGSQVTLSAGLLYQSSITIDPLRELATGFRESERAAVRREAGIHGSFPLSRRLSGDLWTNGALTGIGSQTGEADLAERREIDGGLALHYQITSHQQISLQLQGLQQRDENRTILRLAANPRTDVSAGAAVLQWAVQNRTWQPYGRISYAVRPPSLVERYGDGALILPSDVRPESGWLYQTGISGQVFRTSWLDLRTRQEAFLREQQDLILFLQNSQNSLIAANISAARIAGTVQQLDADLAGRLQLSIRYAFTYTEDRSPIPFYNGNALPYRPLHTLMAMAETSGTWRLLAVVFYEAGNFRDRFNSEFNFLPARLRLDAGAGYVTDRIRITLLMRNLTDQQAADVLGYPLPGLRAELAAQFTGVNL